MPIWLRKFTHKKIGDFLEQKSTSSNSSTKSTLIDENGNVNIPKFMEVSKDYKAPPKYK